MTADSSIDTVASLESLYRDSYKQLVRFAVLFILPKETAEEIVQEIFVATIARALASQSFQIDNPEAFVKQAIVLKARNYHRRNFLRIVKENSHNNDFATSLYDTESSEQHDRVNAIIDALPGAQKECIVLKYYEGLKISEIAELLKISTGTVKSHLHRASTAIRNSFQDTHGGQL